jgi:hypothetical protein
MNGLWVHYARCYRVNTWDLDDITRFCSAGWCDAVCILGCFTLIFKKIVCDVLHRFYEIHDVIYFVQNVLNGKDCCAILQLPPVLGPNRFSPWTAGNPSLRRSS